MGRIGYRAQARHRLCAVGFERRGRKERGMRGRDGGEGEGEGGVRDALTDVWGREDREPARMRFVQGWATRDIGSRAVYGCGVVRFVGCRGGTRVSPGGGG